MGRINSLGFFHGCSFVCDIRIGGHDVVHLFVIEDLFGYIDTCFEHALATPPCDPQIFHNIVIRYCGRVLFHSLVQFTVFFPF